MILIEAGTPSLRAFDAQLIFAWQLAARGHDPVIDASVIEDALDRGRTYEAAPFLRETDDISPSAVMLVGADEIADSTLQRIRGLTLDPAAAFVAIGRFDTPQDLIGARAKIAYALGRDPVAIDLNDLQPRQLLSNAIAPLLAPLSVKQRSPRARPSVTIVLGPDALDEPSAMAELSGLSHSPAYSLKVIVSAGQKKRIKASRFHDLPVITFTELSPVTLAERTDVFVVYGRGIPGDRMAALAVCLMAQGGTVVDCTQDAAFLERGAPAVRGPEMQAALDMFLTGTILPNLPEIGETALRSPWVQVADLSRIEQAAGLEPARPQEEPQRQARAIFMPTNGVGLGHAQRCAVIADQMQHRDDTGFAAFPSCVPLILGRGYDCMPLIQRSGDHAQPFANDVANYLRLSHLLGPKDRLVFDGGYVFDSVARTVTENGLGATWIRRGLWPGGRAANDMLDRERIFDQVIVPGEAFAELNDVYSIAPSVRNVGPIVRPAPTPDGGRDGLRARLAERFDIRFDRLVVSMLGGGVAADRTAQLQAISAMIATRKDTLHLIVVWPGATVAAALYAWPNTRIVQSFEALALAMAADLMISAAGYNSVHEILYHHIPAILIPQTAPFMDDQARRAEALAKRDLCGLVDGTELMQLGTWISRLLDQDGSAQLRKNLRALDLPETGNANAAQLIAEKTWGAA